MTAGDQGYPPAGASPAGSPPGSPPGGPPPAGPAPAGPAPVGPAPVVLRGWTLMVSGLLAVVLGGLWTVQGLDLVGGSMMSGVQLWAIVGPIVVVAGLVLIVLGVRRRTRFKLEQAAAEASEPPA